MLSKICLDWTLQQQEEPPFFGGKLYSHAIVLHIVVVHWHEEDIHHDTQSDEELSEGVEHNDGQHLSCPDPQPATIPNTHHIGSLFNTVKYNILHFWTLVIVILNYQNKKLKTEMFTIILLTWYALLRWVALLWGLSDTWSMISLRTITSWKDTIQTFPFNIGFWALASGISWAGPLLEYVG